MKTRYRVVGTSTVCGVPPGGTLDIDDATTLNVRALVKSGHLVEVKPKPKPDTKKGDD